MNKDQNNEYYHIRETLQDNGRGVNLYIRDGYIHHNDATTAIDLTGDENIHAAHNSPESNTVEIWISDDEDNSRTRTEESQVINTLRIIDNNLAMNQATHSHVHVSNPSLYIHVISLIMIITNFNLAIKHIPS